MKSLIPPLVVLLTVLNLSAQTVVQTADYLPGVLGRAPVNETGLVGDWGLFPNFDQSNTSGAASSVVVAGSLSAPEGYGYTPTNNRYQLTNVLDTASNGVFKLAPSAVIDFDPTTPTSYYISFLESHTPTTAGFTFNFTNQLQFRNDANSNVAQVGMWNSQLRIEAGGNSVSSANLTDGVDRLMVFKIEASNVAGGDNIRGFFVDVGGTVGPEPVVWDFNLENQTINGVATFGNIAQGGFGTANHTTAFDELRIGLSYGAVVPEPTSAAMLLGGLAILVRSRRVRSS